VGGGVFLGVRVYIYHSCFALIGVLTFRVPMAKIDNECYETFIIDFSLGEDDEKKARKLLRMEETHLWPGLFLKENADFIVERSVMKVIEENAKGIPCG
jgi:hypothetical protein